MSAASHLSLSVPLSEVLDPVKWRDRYALGLAVGPKGDSPEDQVRRILAKRKLKECLSDDNLNKWHNLIRWHLKAAASEAAIKLGVPLKTEKVLASPVDDGLVLGRDYDRHRPRLPFYQAETNRWFRIDLGEPILSVERVRGIWLDTTVFDFNVANGDAGYIRIEHERTGSIHIIPPNLNSLVVTTSGFLGTLYTLLNKEQSVPDFWAVDYTTGFIPRHGRPGEIDAVVADWIYSVAGIKILSIGGLAQSQGLSSTSVSLDGASKSVSLQASAIYGINSALEEALRRNTQRIDWKELRCAYRPPIAYLY